MKISMIVAKSLNNVIGVKNALPWNISEDLDFFKKTTLNKTILMGINTYYSIGRALPNRKNLVLTKNKKLKINKCIIINDISDLFLMHEEEIIIIGGENVYRQFINLINHNLYITEVDCIIEKGDAFFPEFKEDEYNLINQEKFFKNEKNDYDFIIKTYQKKTDN